MHPPPDSAELKADAASAKRRGMTFTICHRDKPKAQWRDAEIGISDLIVALKRAAALDAFETAVFTAGPEPLGGFMYWSSRHPEVLNSTVITHEVHR